MAAFLKRLFNPTAMSHAPNPLPSHIYKILPHHSIDSQYFFPTPIPASYEFFVSPLDAKDGFIHLSRKEQLEGTLSRFFADVDKVTLLKVNYPRLSGFKVVKWEKSGSGEVFPHQYGGPLEGEYVDSFKHLEREQGQSWGDLLDQAKRDGWLQ